MATSSTAPHRTVATRLRVALLFGFALLGSCNGSSDSVAPPPGGSIEKAGGDLQTAIAGSQLQPYQVLVKDDSGNPVSGVSVAWEVLTGCGRVSAGQSSTDANGVGASTATLGLPLGSQAVKAAVPGLINSPLVFTSEATAVPGVSFQVLAGCNNVPERFTSDLWVANGYAYVGTWNHFQRTAGVTGAIKIFQLNGAGAPVLLDSIIVAGVNTISDIEVSPDGQWLLATAEGDVNQGIYVYSLANPATPVQSAFAPVSAGLHTGSLGVVGGVLYAFTAKNPPNPALVIFDLSDVTNGNITTASSTPIPPLYGIHDTFVRDGICFAFVWNEGVYIYDVGKGISGGSPQAPVKIGGLQTAGGQAHNGWWFWNPTNGQKKYLFVGEEGPASIGSSSSGDIHVVDVSDLANPVEVATYTYPGGAGAHNFWMDEPNQRLYSAYYDGGVVALDVSGTLSGNLASREIARIRPGGTGSTYVWGVMLAGGALYVADMLSGLWQLSVP